MRAGAVIALINIFLQKFGLERRLILREESVIAKSRLVDFNEFRVSAGETASATLITLRNELRSGEHRGETKTQSLSSRKSQAKQKSCMHTFHRCKDGGLAFSKVAYTHYMQHCPLWSRRTTVAFHDDSC